MRPPLQLLAVPLEDDAAAEHDAVSRVEDGRGHAAGRVVVVGVRLRERSARLLRLVVADQPHRVAALARDRRAVVEAGRRRAVAHRLAGGAEADRGEAGRQRHLAGADRQARRSRACRAWRRRARAPAARTRSGRRSRRAPGRRPSGRRSRGRRRAAPRGASRPRAATRASGAAASAGGCVCAIGRPSRGVGLCAHAGLGDLRRARPRVSGVRVAGMSTDGDRRVQPFTR